MDVAECEIGEDKPSEASKTSDNKVSILGAKVYNGDPEIRKVMSPSLWLSINTFLVRANKSQ